MSNYYKVEQAEEGHFRLNSKEHVFMDLFIGQDKALLLDTGNGFGELARQVKELTKDLPLVIVNTHGHIDHSGGNYQFEETCYLCQRDEQLIHQYNSYEKRLEAVEGAEHEVSIFTGKVENNLPEDMDRENYLQGGYGHIAFTKEGDVFELGGLTLEVFEFPGHTAGGIGLYWRQQDTMFVGDAMNSFVWMFLPESLMLSDYIKTLHKAYDLNFAYFYQGHAPGRFDRSILLDYIAIAEHLDFDRGYDFQTAMAPGLKPRICTLEGYGPNDFLKPGFTSIVISKEHIDL